MTRYDAIDEYMAGLHDRLRWRPDIEDLAAEVEDHLYSTVERLVADGLAVDEAQRVALRRFGRADGVARAFATTSDGGTAMPTDSTRMAGTLAIVSAALWLVVVMAWWAAGLANGPWRSGNYVALLYAPGAIALLGALGCLAASMAGMAQRHGGLGRLGTAGLVLVIVGVAGGLAAWVFTVWGALIAIGNLIFAMAMVRRDLAPRLPTVCFGGGFVLGAAVWVILRSAHGVVDLGGLWSTEWPDNQVGLTVGAVILAVGLLGLGRWLRSEEPANLEVPDDTVAA